MKVIIENALQRLAQGCPSLQCVDKDRGQLLAASPSVQWPCALVDLREANYSLLRDGSQTVEARIVVTLADVEPASESGSSLRVLELIGQIKESLQGWEPAAYCGPMNLQVLKRRIMKQTDCEVYRLEFRVRYSEVPG